ncbi:MAG: GGDEF domain-containing protein [Pseudomonadota bacterium]
MIDIDHFKNINDAHGHKVGDIVLQELANILRNTFRTVDVIGRIGGEEFAVVLPETELQQALEVAERLRMNAAEADLEQAAGLPLHFTVSVGVVALAGRDISLGNLLDLADTALYEAKQGGRNRVCVSP